jgi:hypothetical protein
MVRHLTPSRQTSSWERRGSATPAPTTMGNEEIYWFPYDMILDGDTGAVKYVPT